jgi:hypothetical protein
MVECMSEKPKDEGCMSVLMLVLIAASAGQGRWLKLERGELLGGMYLSRPGCTIECWRAQRDMKRDYNLRDAAKVVSESSDISDTVGRLGAGES